MHFAWLSSGHAIIVSSSTKCIQYIEASPSPLHPHTHTHTDYMVTMIVFTQTTVLSDTATERQLTLDDARKTTI